MSLHLGRTVDYPTHYDAGLLQALPRSSGRKDLGPATQRMSGFDLWRAWEFAWLDSSGRPHPRVVELEVPADSAAIVESKSLKLYLYGLCNRMVSGEEEVVEILKGDLEPRLESHLRLRLLSPEDSTIREVRTPVGECIDSAEPGDLDAEPDADRLVASRGENVGRDYVCNTFRSICPVTGQPDWATVQISLSGAALEQAGLHRYLLGFREHRGFHEQCIERIFCDLVERCSPEQLSVTGFFLRRGGIDINPVRHTGGVTRDSLPRLPRQ